MSDEYIRKKCEYTAHDIKSINCEFYIVPQLDCFDRKIVLEMCWFKHIKFSFRITRR